MRRILTVAIAAAVLGGWAAPAIAPASSYSTEVGINIGIIATGVFAEGQVLSPKRACVAGRKVLIIAITPNGNQIVDIDHASDNGFYGGSGRADGADHPTGVKVKAPRTVFVHHGRRHACRRNSYALHIPGG